MPNFVVKMGMFGMRQRQQCVFCCLFSIGWKDS